MMRDNIDLKRLSTKRNRIAACLYRREGSDGLIDIENGRRVHCIIWENDYWFCKTCGEKIKYEPARIRKIVSKFNVYLKAKAKYDNSKAKSSKPKT